MPQKSYDLKNNSLMIQINGSWHELKGFADGSMIEVNYNQEHAEVEVKEQQATEQDLPLHKPQPEYIETSPAFVCGPEHEAVNDGRVFEVE